MPHPLNSTQTPPSTLHTKSKSGVPTAYELIGLRMKLGLSQKELATMLQLSPAQLIAWEAGLGAPSQDDAMLLLSLSQDVTTLLYLAECSGVSIHPEIAKRLMAEQH